uniref:Str_synth domain-containing protein n=1 Tax=Heterorhabditis bacteriophora TaxID=37862 RepID=A0A1I7X733_HETBA
MDLDTGKRRTLFSDVLEEPRAIAVDPEMGLIFWTDWGKMARIERAGMDGQHRTVIFRKLKKAVGSVDLATNGASSGFSLSTMLFLLMLSIFTVMVSYILLKRIIYFSVFNFEPLIKGLVYYRRRRSTGTFTALNFDNPIYRRTVEAEMDDPFRDPFRDDPQADGVLPPSRLVLADPENNVHNSIIEPMDRPLTS